jgi:DNA modification methylase
MFLFCWFICITLDISKEQKLFLKKKKNKGSINKMNEEIKKLCQDSLQINKIYNMDCIKGMNLLEDDSIDFTLTDIPYDASNRQSNGLRNLDKENADVLTFELQPFLEEVYRVTKNSICIFCGKEQFSEIYGFFAGKKGTVRPIIWEKTNPSPMNGQYIYLSGVEMAVWFKKSGAKTFNAHCKNTVFKYSNGKRKIHPTQKNLKLFEELIKDNTNENDIVLDTCMGSGTTAVACMELNRRYIGFEIDKKYYIEMVNSLNIEETGIL